MANSEWRIENSERYMRIFSNGLTWDRHSCVPLRKADRNVCPTNGLGILFIVLTFAVAGCSKSAPEDMEFPPPAVSVSLPLEREVTDYQNFTGRMAAITMVQVRARVTGYLDKVNFKEGDLVKEKDVLVEIDPRTYQAAYEQAEANVAQFEARVYRLQGDYDRARGLFGKGTISKEEFEKYNGDLREAQASLNSNKAAMTSAKLNVDFTRVLAPVSGRVSRRNVDPGNLIKADDTILTNIVTQDPMYVYFDIDDRAYLQIDKMVREGKIGTPASTAGKGKEAAAAANALIPVQLGLINEKGYPHSGIINFVDNQIDASTGTMRMRGVFDNKVGLLTPGLFVRVRLPMDEPHKAILITDRAVDTDQGQKVVYVVGKDNAVEKREVQLGGVHDGLREIISGVRVGDQAVVDGIQRVRAGAKVNPKAVEMPGAAENDRESVAKKSPKS
jgi:RND family efflux transporter MFP subunit